MDQIDQTDGDLDLLLHILTDRYEMFRVCIVQIQPYIHGSCGLYGSHPEA